MERRRAMRALELNYLEECFRTKLSLPGWRGVGQGVLYQRHPGHSHTAAAASPPLQRLVVSRLLAAALVAFASGPDAAASAPTCTAPAREHILTSKRTHSN